MSASAGFAAVGYQFEATPDLSSSETRERLSRSAMEGFFAIVDKWGLSSSQAGGLLGGTPRATLHRLRTAAAGALRQDQLTRISYLVGIYKALHILLPADLANRWMVAPNDSYLFGGSSPLAYVTRAGIPGLQQVRSLLDAARGGQ